jgi:aerobic-type carbon monoxide dehydrogenase small subunit (CoxS/CutS family)
MRLEVEVNGRERALEIEPGDLLLDVLRRYGYYGVKRGCDTGDCGSCAVLVDERAINSCIAFAGQMGGKRLLTIEGFGTPEHLDPLQEAFLERGAVQCGYCTPAMILLAKTLLDEDPQPSERAVREVLAGVLCRCTGYRKPIEAVLLAAERMRKR